jgi:hypothetical protein
MVRNSLSICLILTTLTGQCLCCCTAARLLEPKSAPDQARRPIPPCCCCGLGEPASGSRAVMAKVHRERSPSPAQPRCPCREQKSQTTISDFSGTQGAWHTASKLQSVDAASIATAASPTADGRSPVSAERRHFPFLTAQDILRALHILRC